LEIDQSYETLTFQELRKMSGQVGLKSFEAEPSDRLIS
jgi:hypothetical protein